MKDAPPPPVIGRKRKEQLDLFGPPTDKKPKAGNRHHIKLTSTGNERIVVPGMASYAGEGPPGKYCQNCHWYGAVLVQRPDYDTSEAASEACALWAKRMGHAAPIGTQRNIAHCAACKHFQERTQAFSAFRISAAGELEER